jgi:hypothetical protein
MSEAFTVDIFVEDRAHEQLIVPLVERVAREEGITVAPRVRSARGGHGRAMEEFNLYQRVTTKGIPGATEAQLVVVGKDGNCSTFRKAKKEIQAAILRAFSIPVVVACPAPHVERWYLADPESFRTVVGRAPTLKKDKCDRDYYKAAMVRAVREAGHPPTLGGIEFARELVTAMDLYRAGRNDRSLKVFIDELRNGLRTLKERP